MPMKILWQPLIVLHNVFEGLQGGIEKNLSL